MWPRNDRTEPQSTGNYSRRLSTSLMTDITISVMQVRANITGWVPISHVWLHCPDKVCTQKISPASRQTNASSAFHHCIMKDTLVSCDLSGDAFRPHSHQQEFFFLYNNVVQHHLHKHIKTAKWLINFFMDKDLKANQLFNKDSYYIVL